MTDAEKVTFSRACELADKISEETEFAAVVEYAPNWSWKAEARWFKFSGSKCVKCGGVYGIDNIVPYLETIYQFAPRKADGA